MASTIESIRDAGAEGVAIIGMACLFPGAADVDAFWANVLAKVDSVSDPPPGSWDTSIHYDPDSTDSDRIYAKRGGYIAHMATFDPLKHGIPPSAVGGEPDQWLALDIARRALDDAGYADLAADVRHKTAVILGRGALPNVGSLTAIQHGLIVSQTLEIVKRLNPELPPERLEAIRTALRASLPDFGPDTAPGFVANLIVGRIANRLDLMGSNLTVDAACASSHMAIEIGISQLRNRTADLVLAGGSHVSTPVPMLGLFSQLGALSRAERIRPFDKDADGTLLGEGIGMVVLKRLAEAERDGDRIYSVIRGVGVASDGKAVGVMAPRVEGEELAIRRAYELANVPPDSVELIEAHGTGTIVGDQVEIQALGRVLGKRQTALPTIALGSVKSMIGHLVPAAGIAAIIKTSLALYHKMLPPTLNVDEPNPEFALAESPLYINTSLRPWINGRDHPRRAGVSAFGFGGVDAHVVLEEHTAADSQRPLDHLPAWETEVVAITADTRIELAERAAALGRQVEALAGRRRPPRLQDVAYSINRAASIDGTSAVLGVVAGSLSDLQFKLTRAADRLSDPTRTRIKEASGIFYTDDPLAGRGKVCFLLPGEGARYENMLADLCVSLPMVRETFDTADRYFRERGRPIVPSDYVFPRSTFTDDERQSAQRMLADMDNAVSAVLIADEALLRVMDALGVRADGVVGHSVGEFAALRAAGVLGNEADGAEMGFYDMLVEAGRPRPVEDGIVPATLVAIGGGRDDVESMIDGRSAQVVADNCHHQVVVAVDTERLEGLLESVKQRGMLAERLPFDRGYHTAQFTPLASRLRAALGKLQLHEPAVPVYSCATGRPYAGDIAALASEQLARPVEFRRTIEQMHDDGYRIYIEVGPRGSLTTFVEDILRGREFTAVAVNQARLSGVSQLNQAMAMLAAEGVMIDVELVHRHRGSREVDLESAAVESETSSAVLLPLGFPAMTLNTEAVGLQSVGSAAIVSSDAPARRSEVPSDSGDAAPPTVPALVNGDLAEVTTRFLETMDHFLEVQQQVMLQHLAATGGHSSSLDGHLPALDRHASALDGHASALDGRLPAVHGRSSSGGNGASVASQAAAAAPLAGTAAPATSVAASADGADENLAANLPAMLLEIVVERTGYPADVISLDADLEADLGIDSIKRVEILTTLRRRVAAGGEVDLQQLTTKRTLNEIIEVLSAAWR